MRCEKVLVSGANHPDKQVMANVHDEERQIRWQMRNSLKIPKNSRREGRRKTPAGPLGRKGGLLQKCPEERPRRIRYRKTGALIKNLVSGDFKSRRDTGTAIKRHVGKEA